jgi:1,4-dihydroxy-2-naphthoate octaprenyltransferase
VAAAAVALVGVALSTSWWALLGLVFLAPGLAAVRTVLGGAGGPGLVPVLQQTGIAELLHGLGLFAGLLLASS